MHSWHWKYKFEKYMRTLLNSPLYLLGVSRLENKGTDIEMSSAKDIIDNTTLRHLFNKSAQMRVILEAIYDDN